MENLLKYANEIEDKKRDAKIKARKYIALGIVCILSSPIIFILSLILSICQNEFCYIILSPSVFVYGIFSYLTGKIHWWINDV